MPNLLSRDSAQLSSAANRHFFEGMRAPLAHSFPWAAADPLRLQLLSHSLTSALGKGIAHARFSRSPSTFFSLPSRDKNLLWPNRAVGKSNPALGRVEY